MADGIKSIGPREAVAPTLDPPKSVGKSLPPTESEQLQAKIDSKVRELQGLWSSYEKNPRQDIEKTITVSVNELEKLLPRLTNLGDVDDTRDFLLACRMTMLTYFQNPKALAAPEPIKPKQTPAPAPLPAAMTERTSPRSRQTQEVLAILKQDHDVVDVRGDGNCAIRAVLNPLGLNNDATVMLVRGEMVHRMREAMLDEVENHWPEVLSGQGRYVPLLGEFNDDQAIARANIERYCEFMARHGEWLGELEFKFLPQVIGQSIRVIDPSKVEIKDGKLNINDSMLRHGPFEQTVTVWCNEGHYQSVIKKN